MGNSGGRFSAISFSRLIRLLPLLLLLALPIACSGNDPGQSEPNTPSGPNDSVQRDAERVVATVLLANNELVLVGLRPASADDLPPVPASDPRLEWQFEDENGNVVANGEITAPLLATSEFDESGQPNPVEATAGAALFELDIPNVGGTLTLTDPAAPSGGTQTQSWGSFFKQLKVFIQKLIGTFTFHPGGGSNGSGGATGSGGSNGSGGATGSGGASGGNAAKIIEVGPTTQIQKPQSACTAFTILLVAEGYTKSEKAKFDTDAKAILATMAKKPVYSENWKYVSAYEKFFVSHDSGISDLATGVQRDTAFRVAHDAKTHRVILMQPDAPKDALAKLAAAKGEANAQVVLVIANTAEYAGVAIPSQRIGYASTHPDSGSIMGHELGHALFGLSDEYDYGTCDPANSFVGPNVAVGLKALPWTPLLTKGVSLPTVGGAANTVGAYEGALYCAKGVYRPQQNCYMKELASDFCAVCAAQVNKFFTDRTMACQPKAGCAHSECTSGDPLGKSCSACSASVCLTNPDCCNPAKKWDDTCVQVASKLQTACHGVCADGNSSCSHSECAAGTALGQSCSGCAKAICTRDAYCCNGKWDAICANEAKKDPYCSCSS